MTSHVGPTEGAQVVRVPPPLFYGGGLALGMAVHRLVPFRIGGRPATTVAGAAIVASGLALTASGAAGVLRHRTTIIPHHPVSTLVTSGAYRVSRNPMYTGLGIAYLGAALLLDSWWPVTLWPLAVLAIDRLVIRPEERYLAERFGQVYADYRNRVRRWL